MTTRRPMTTGMLVAVLLCAPLHAQDAGRVGSAASPYLDERGGLGLDDAIARALEREPMLRATRAEIEIARGRRQQASLRPNPTLTFERRDEPRGTDSLTAVGVEWPLELFRRSGRVQTADHELAATGLAVADRERLLAAEVRTQYGIATAAVRDVSVADELAATVERQLDLMQVRVTEGAARPLDRDLLEVEARRTQAERIRAASRAEVAIAELKQLLGMGPHEPLQVREPLETLVVGLAAAPATTGPPASINTRPDVREADARVRLADARVDQARREGRLDVSLFGTYMRMDAGFQQLGVDASGSLERVRGRFNYVAGGAMVTLPIFDRNQGQVAAAQAERSGAEARREAAGLAARSEVAAARARDARAREALTLYTGGARTLARQNLDVVRQTFDLGRATVFDVLTEHRRYLEFEQAYTTTLREAWEARTALKRALGEAK